MFLILLMPAGIQLFWKAMNLKGAIIEHRDTLALHGDVIPLQQQVTYTPGD